MSELDELWAARQELAAKLAQQEADAQALANRLARLQAQRRALVRRTNPKEGDTDELKKLDDEIAQAEKELAAAREAVAQTRQELAEVTQKFGELSDPIKQLPNLDPEIPLLLMPVRLETRFKDKELWVRVYPDDWAVDTFEEQLADLEIVSLQRFWSGMWRAGGDDAMRRAAWRGLVASHGSGRAGWMTQQYTPANQGDEPTRTSAEQVILVVALDEPLTTTDDRTACRRYWDTVWRNVDDGAALADARQELDDSVKPEVAENILAHPPFNLDEKPADGVERSTADVMVVLLELPPVKVDETKLTSWTQPARAHVLPDRFILMGFQGSKQVLFEIGNAIPPSLVVGPNPSAPPEEQFRIVDGELVIPDELRWMVDFDEAINVGMGFKVPLNADTGNDFGRLFVVGIQVASKPEEAAARLTTLLTHHHHSRTGLSLLPQGAPTNNTDGHAAGFDRADDADESYDVWFGAGSPLADRPAFDEKQDGQWLAELLGLDPADLATVIGVGHTDQAEAHLMNTALWPATWGYFLDTMMHPLLEGAEIDEVRAYFIRCVSGRGLVPPIRIGRQPYGILPTTALAQLGFGRRRDDDRDIVDLPTFLARLDQLLHKVTLDWAPLVSAVPHVGGGGDAHQTLLDVVALHPASVEFHQRYGESDEDIWNRFSLNGLAADFLSVWLAMGGVDAGRQLLMNLGWDGAGDDPSIIHLLFHGRQHKLQGPLIDDRPLSEQNPVRVYTDDQRNYLQWLADAAQTSLEALRRQDGFTDDKVPNALLYLLLRHALLLSWWQTGLKFRLQAGDIDATAYRLAHQESPYVHVAAAAGGSESRWHTLYTPSVKITGDPDRPLFEHLPGLLKQPPAKHLADVIAAIGRLSGLPTARLERLLAEHLDTCSHRLDAWRLGLIHHRLLTMRLGPDGALGEKPPAAGPRRGIHLGAYGWLENVFPEAHVLEPVKLPPELEEEFGDKNRPPLMRDLSNGGYVHAPSIDHASAAAVLRSGFLANATPAHPDTMAVNISSERVRLAMSVLQGVREGQSLGALLGYRLERGLHDRHGLAEVDHVIYDLRKVFPSPADPEGRQVVDALDLLQQIEKSGIATYPFGHPGLPALQTAAEAAAVNAEIVRLRDVHDAVADLALAEGVYQAVMGNFDRVAATLDAYGQLGFPPEPGVLETPRRGRALTHRVGIHLRPGLSHTTSPVAGVPMTPRAAAEPAVNEMLAALLPPPADVAVLVTWTDLADVEHEVVVTQADLDLQPLDLLHLLRLEDGAALGELDERVLRFVETTEGLRPDLVPSIEFTAQVEDHVTFFELAPLVAQLRSALTRARPLKASDVMLANEASRSDDVVAGQVDRDRPATVLARLQTWRSGAADVVADIDALLADEVANRAALVSGCNTFADRAISALLSAGTFALPGSGWGEIGERRRGLFDDLLGRVAAVIARWEPRLVEANALLVRDHDLPVTAGAVERNRLLLLAEQQVRTTVTNPLPASPDDYRNAVIDARDDFEAKLDDLRAVAPAATTVTALFATVAGLLPLSAFDTVGLDLAPAEDRAVDLCRYLRDRVAAVVAEADHRIGGATQALADADAAPPGQAQITAATAAVKALLGEDALVVPEFTLLPAQGAEWAAAMAWSRTGNLTAHLAADHVFPVDDWLHGVARVRDKVRCWEQLALLSSVVGQAEPELWPVQLPHANEPWFALELPAGVSVPGDRLLYTAHYPVAFDPSAAQCGLLLDEWVETIPEDSVTTGVTFHYDRPDSEPPQAMLLAVPPAPGVPWRWDDLVQTLHDTLELARLRAVEPDQVATTPYGGFLPATVMSATVRGVSISANLALNNDLFAYLRDDDG